MSNLHNSIQFNWKSIGQHFQSYKNSNYQHYEKPQKLQVFVWRNKNFFKQLKFSYYLNHQLMIN
jgi:hypothetical protein